MSYFLTSKEKYYLSHRCVHRKKNTYSAIYNKIMLYIQYSYIYINNT